MAESECFEWVAGELEARTVLTRLEARGTVRLVLKHAGLDPASVAGYQMAVVLQRLMPPQLAKRRVAEAAELCSQLAQEVQEEATRFESSEDDGAYDVFQRFDSHGGGS